MNQQRKSGRRKRPMRIMFFLLFCIATCKAALSGQPDSNKNNSDMYYTSVCEGKTMDLQCKGGKVIMIESANFGRTDDQTCAGFGPVDNTECELPATFVIVSTICNDRPTCTIPVNTDLFGDPCEGVFKFLELQLICVMHSDPTASMPTDGVVTTTSTERKMTTPTMMHIPTSRETMTTKPPQVETTTIKKVPPTTKPLPNTCPGTERRGISWPSTKIGVRVDRPCPEGSKGLASWECTGGTSALAVWKEPGPNLSNCQSEWVVNVNQMASKGANATTVSTAIIEQIDSNEVVYGSDIQAVATYMSNSITDFEESLSTLGDNEKSDATHTVSKNYLEITSAMLDNNNIDSWNDLDEVDQSSSASNILSSLEESAFLWADTIELTPAEEQMTVTLEESNVVMSIMVQDHSHGSPVDATFPLKNLIGPSMWTSIEDCITIPRENFNTSQSGKLKVVFLAYNNIQDYLTYYPPKPNGKSAFVNSRVMSASLNSATKPSKLKEPVIISFAHIKDNITNPSCSFWDFKNSSYGEWSGEGCKVIKTNSTHTVCSCNHLTNFAILMNVQAVELTQPHTFALSVITYFGFIISCVCLLLAFITFSMFKNLQNDRTTIHKNLCLTLLIAEIIFMAGISQVGQKVLCSIVAMLLHYFFLSAFAWMCLEGIQLYVMLVEVFEAESSRRKYYYPFGYGLPAVVVAISAAVNYQGYGTDDYCWLSTSENFIWAFVAPVCLIILVNTVFLTMAMYIMCRHSNLQTNPKEKNTGDKISSWMRGALVLLCLLGITWVFGLAYINADMVVFAYIFTIFNALQGMFIFLFHCLMNDKVRKEYRRYIRNSTWLPACIRDNYGGVFSSNSNQQQSFRSSSSGRGRTGVSHDSKRFSNATGSYSFEQRKLSCSSGCRCSGEYLPIQSPPPIDSDHIDSYDYEEVPENGFIPSRILKEAEHHDQHGGSATHDEGIGLELEGHPTWNDRPCVLVDNASGDFARFCKTDVMASSMERLPREDNSLMRESGIGNDSQATSPESESLPTISFHVQRSDPDLSLLSQSLKPLLNMKECPDIHRESGIGASHSESDQSSASSEQMCPGSPVITPDMPSKAYIFPNPSSSHPNHTSMPDLVNPIQGQRAQFNEVPSDEHINFLSLPKKSHSSVGVGESRKAYSDSKPGHSASADAELYVPQTFSRLETLI